MLERHAVAPGRCLVGLGMGRGCWIASSFWYDGLFLPFDTVMPAPSFFLEPFTRLLEARSQVLPPTFVVAPPRS